MTTTQGCCFGVMDAVVVVFGVMDGVVGVMNAVVFVLVS